MNRNLVGSIYGRSSIKSAHFVPFHSPSFGSFGQAVSEEKNFKNQPIRNQNRLWWPCLLIEWDGMSILYRGPSIDASYQVSDHLAKRFLTCDVAITCSRHDKSEKLLHLFLATNSHSVVKNEVKLCQFF
jgi:hypothetical protein